MMRAGETMLKFHVFRSRFLAGAALAAVLALTVQPAHAVSKEIIQLQTQVQQLLDMVQRLQSSFDQRFAVLQNLAQQTSDQATQMSATVKALEQKLNTQNEALGSKVDTASGQVQSLNDSVDELKSRIAKLDKSIQDMQAQLQNIQAQQAAQTAATAPGAAGAPAAPAVSQTPPLEDTYQAGLRDYNAGKFDVAAGEFQDVVKYYPMDDLAGTAQFYLGEIAYQQKDYETAVNNYNAVLEGFSGNTKAPAAQLHKGYSLLEENKKQAGINELRQLIKRYPQTPEAARARSKLNGMGVKITASPSAR
jgi:tol-pal system protein YbgF